MVARNSTRCASFLDARDLEQDARCAQAFQLMGRFSGVAECEQPRLGAIRENQRRKLRRDFISSRIDKS